MSEVLTMPRAEETREPAGGFVMFSSMTGPALVRLDPAFTVSSDDFNRVTTDFCVFFCIYEYVRKVC